jgi:thymidine kinase
MIEVITGCMFSGKSEELMRRLKRYQIADLSVAAYKPEIDDRYSEDICSHSKNIFSAKTFKNFQHLVKILLKYKDENGEFPNVIGIDEAQFLPEHIVPFVQMLAYSGSRIIISGLDLDYSGKPFGPMPDLMAIAEKVDKKTAICVARKTDGKVCGMPATRSFRIAEGDTAIISVGAIEKYEARCFDCWKKNKI